MASGEILGSKNYTSITMNGIHLQEFFEGEVGALRPHVALLLAKESNAFFRFK